jgi:hypothetical protein
VIVLEAEDGNEVEVEVEAGGRNDEGWESRLVSVGDG